MQISQRQAEISAALGDVHRLLLLYALEDEAQSVSELVERVGLSQPSVSRHLRILREAGIVCADRRGKSIYYCPADRRIYAVIDLLRAISTDQMQRKGDVAYRAAPRPHV